MALAGKMSGEELGFLRQSNLLGLCLAFPCASDAY